MAKHREAFCLMKYRCDKCGKEEIVWNSRDGVTPFSIPCSRKQHCAGLSSHVDWHLDKSKKKYKLVSGQRYFVDMTSDRAWALATEVILARIESGEVISEQELFEKTQKIYLSFYGQGHEPDLLVYSKPRKAITEQSVTGRSTSPSPCIQNLGTSTPEAQRVISAFTTLTA